MHGGKIRHFMFRYFWFATLVDRSVKAVTNKPFGLRCRRPALARNWRFDKLAANGNPLLVDRVISKDGKTTAIYVPLEQGANGAIIAGNIREIVAKEKGPEHYYVAGDPVARDTFGAEMFKLMGIFSPVAGMIMFIAIQIIFRNLSLSFTMMGVAMAAIIISMGSLIGAGYPSSNTATAQSKNWPCHGRNATAESRF